MVEWVAEPAGSIVILELFIFPLIACSDELLSLLSMLVTVNFYGFLFWYCEQFGYRPG